MTLPSLPLPSKPHYAWSLARPTVGPSSFSLSCSSMHSQACLNFHTIISTLGSCLRNNCQLFFLEQGCVLLTKQQVWWWYFAQMVVVSSFIAHPQVIPWATHEQHTEQRSAQPPPQNSSRVMNQQDMPPLCSLARPLLLSLTQSFVYVNLLLPMRPTTASCLSPLPPPAALL